MDKIKQISGFKIALYSGSETKSSREIVSTLSHRPDTGFLHSFSHPDYIEVIQSGGIQQSNLFLASAGNVLRMTTMRPNPLTSAGIGERGSKFRGFPQLSTRTN